jgi:hypothetical protein
MAEKKEKAQYSKPASQLDLERRLENGNESDRVLSTADSFKKPSVNEGDGRDFRVEDNETENYLGVSPEYATYANETEKPGFSEENPEDQVAAEFYDSFQRFVDPVNRDDHEEVEESGGTVAEPESQADEGSGSSSGSTGN